MGKRPRKDASTKVLDEWFVEFTWPDGHIEHRRQRSRRVAERTVQYHTNDAGHLPGVEVKLAHRTRTVAVSAMTYVDCNPADVAQRPDQLDDDLADPNTRSWAVAQFAAMLGRTITAANENADGHTVSHDPAYATLEDLASRFSWRSRTWVADLLEETIAGRVDLPGVYVEPLDVDQFRLTSVNARLSPDEADVALAVLLQDLIAVEAPGVDQVQVSVGEVARQFQGRSRQWVTQRLQLAAGVGPRLPGVLVTELDVDGMYEVTLDELHVDPDEPVAPPEVDLTFGAGRPAGA